MSARSDSGNDMWHSLSDGERNGHGVLEELTEADVSPTNITLLVAHLINDSKYNVAKRNKFYHSSRSFLLNEDGALEHWLNMIHVDDMDLVLWKLRDFVYNGTIESLGYLRRLV